ncbi:DUF4254 domain-containing protein [Nocardia sp. NPDC005978]|uniref:DUF4254 domain-containing protein n=1 Tax=unclassified Nocardia TaxID=2637762 RepID=UPI0033BC8F08
MYIRQPDSTHPWPTSFRHNDFEMHAHLPDWHELLAAFCGHIGDRSQDHPVTKLARALAELHLERLELRLEHRVEPGETGRIDELRAGIVVRIDEWVANRARRRGARAESLGAVVDAMAAAHVHAVHLLKTAERVSDEEVHAAWYLLAQMADGWTDRAAGVTGPRIRRSA